ncbi:MAG: hypothetical protein ACI8X5_001056 [Planctomycetota bacterium]|jgi:hypothetical protein
MMNSCRASISLAFFLLLAHFAFAGPAFSQGRPIGFEETYALGTDRLKALEELIPGSREYYYYSCLERQSAGALEEAAELLRLWIERHGRNERVIEIENRQALMTFEVNPKSTYDFLIKRLNLRFNHERQLGGESNSRPSRLDPALLSEERLRERAFDFHRNDVNGFRESSFAFLVNEKLSERRLLSLLQRVQRPDLPGLAALVVRELETKRSRGFGALAIHQNLLLSQLEECLRLRPALLEQKAFINVYLQRLEPSADVQWQFDEHAREFYLDRLEAFVQRLSPAYNSLKSHVLHHRLVHDLALNRLNKERLLRYLKLPRQTSYVNVEYLRSRGSGQALVNDAEAFATKLTPVGNDESLVRSYLGHFFLKDQSFSEYAEYLDENYLERLFAETMILAGVGDMERWYSLMDNPGYYEKMKERVEIEFSASQRTHYSAGEAISVDLNVKNVGTLIVKIFEINTFNYYRDDNREVDASIDLDGLVANWESTHEFEEGPLRRVQRTISLPELADAGVYVVDLIGNGLSSRAVIHKGRLQYEDRLGAAGHVLRVSNEAGVLQVGASIWFAGREFRAEENGELFLPYSTEPGTEKMLLRSGDQTSLVDFMHRAETYELQAGIHVEREALLPGSMAKILVRPSLKLNGNPVSLSLLENVKLVVTSLDSERVPSILEVPDLDLVWSAEAVQEIQVPEDLRVLRVELHAEIKSLSSGENLDLQSKLRVFRLNQIDATLKTDCPLLSRSSAGYVLDVLGKNGEPRVGRVVDLKFELRDYSDALEVRLETDKDGRIHLGELDGVLSVKANGFSGNPGIWSLNSSGRSYPIRVNGAFGEVLRIPYEGSATDPSRSEFSLIELRGGAFARDVFAALSIESGYLELHGLEPGDYDLWLKAVDRKVDIRITAGEAKAGWVVGRDRRLQLAAQPMQVVKAQIDGDDLVIQLDKARTDARVNVFTTRYLPAYNPYGDLWAMNAPMPDVIQTEHPRSTYNSGREIGDEYRYILDRRFAARFPGNMLGRPGLLLNPWALEETESVIGVGGGFGGRFGGRKDRRAEGRVQSARNPVQSADQPGTYPNLSFLSQPAVTLVNLQPDENGVVRVPVSSLGEGSLVHVVALDSVSTVYKALERAEKPLTRVDQRLAQALPVEGNYTESQTIEFVDTGATIAIEDAGHSKLKVYDSLASVYQFYRTFTKNADLVEFAFVVGWPELTPEEKLSKYSKYACHELHFFLYEKDRAFFDSVVLPYLVNKAHKTFMDEWLLERDLESYLEPWKFAQLNTLEQILLTRRLVGRGVEGARHISELVDLLPPNPGRFEFLFKVALRSNSLEEAGAVQAGLELVLEEREQQVADALNSLGYISGGPSSPGPAGPGAPATPALQDAMETSSDDFFLGKGQKEQKGKAKSDEARRKEVRQFFRGPDPTRPYVENNYWHLRVDQMNAELVGPNNFWLDYANRPNAAAFFSPHFVESVGSFAEMMLALSVLDLPFKAGEHAVDVDGWKLTMESASPLLLVREDLTMGEIDESKQPVLVSQNLFRADDRYRYEGNQRFDRFVTAEFLPEVAYGAQVVVTNPTSSSRQLKLLIQIPQGAIALSNGARTSGRSLSLDSFGTQVVEYYFYFPKTGGFSHYPAQLSESASLIASASAMAINVVPELSELDTTSWEYVSQAGSSEDVFTFLQSANLQRTDLSRIAWRMGELEFFTATLGLLRLRHRFDQTLWSYGLRHGDLPASREFLSADLSFIGQCGLYLDTPLLAVNPVERHFYQQVEFKPLVNPRAHSFGRQREILDLGVSQQYDSLLRMLAYKPRLEDGDWLMVTYYLLLQDRTAEALASFARVRPERLESKLQYDYMRAYLDFFTPGLADARSIAEGYRDHPVQHWAELFQNVLGQLDEAEGKPGATSDPDDHVQGQGTLAESEPALEVSVEREGVTLTYQNLDECVVNYYAMDIEFLFSTNPFGQQDSGSFAYIRPNRTVRLALAAGTESQSFDLPEEFRSANVLVEVRAAGITQREVHYANSLTVRTYDTYGQLKATESKSSKPLSTVYIKVFARDENGAVRFHKDGYTDLRGRFDYASLSGASDLPATDYSILVLSDEHGAVIREVMAPKR